MSKSSAIIGTLATVLLLSAVTVGWALGASKPTRQERTPSRTTATSKEESPELDRLEQRLAALERDQRRGWTPITAPQKERGATAAQERQDRQARPSRSEEETVLENTRLVRARLAAIEGTLRREKRDNEWSPLAENAIAEAAQRAQLPGVEILATECQSTLCRMTMSFEDADAAQAASSSVSSLVPWDTRFFFSTTRDDVTGQHEGVYYVAREGHDLPSEVASL